MAKGCVLPIVAGDAIASAAVAARTDKLLLVNGLGAVICAGGLVLKPPRKAVSGSPEKPWVEGCYYMALLVLLMLGLAQLMLFAAVAGRYAAARPHVRGLSAALMRAMLAPAVVVFVILASGY